MIFAHKIALDLTQAQKAYCRKAAGTARFTYNWGLSQWQEGSLDRKIMFHGVLRMRSMHTWQGCQSPYHS
jgi:hypothetical protein